MEGFVFAITPFNFTSIGGNLPTAPALMGNTVLWKPASTSVLSSYYIMKILKEAGLPKGVINFIPGKGSEIGKVVLEHPELAGIHFTGSTTVSQSMWKTVANNINNYRSYPRLIGETGGKDFVFVYKDSNPKEVAIALVRGRRSVGQKCSAASRAYIPTSLWNKTKKHITEMVSKIKIGDVTDFTNFMGAAIDRTALRTSRDT